METTKTVIERVCSCTYILLGLPKHSFVLVPHHQVFNLDELVVELKVLALKSLVVLLVHLVQILQFLDLQRPNLLLLVLFDHLFHLKGQLFYHALVENHVILQHAFFGLMLCLQVFNDGLHVADREGWLVRFFR